MKLEYRVTNSAAFRRALEEDAKKAKRASSAAAKVEGYRLMKEMKAEIKSGDPGGKAFSPLSYIRSGKLSGGRKALSRLAITPRYATIDQEGQSKTMVGFLTVKLSRKWIQIADKHQEGFSESADSLQWGGTTLRKRFARIGAALKKKNPALARYYFLKKSTTTLKTPARLVIVPFWNKHQNLAITNIIANFERKMRGERI